MWKLGIVGFESVSSITDTEDLTESCKVYTTYIDLNLGSRFGVRILTYLKLSFY
jgi:hypothetical protein